MYIRRFPQHDRPQKLEVFHGELLIDESNNEWYVTKMFYSALHIMSLAYEVLTNSNSPKSHKAAKIAYPGKLPQDIIDRYERLLDLSHKARYRVAPADIISDPEVDVAVEDYNEILRWARSQTMLNTYMP